MEPSMRIACACGSLMCASGMPISACTTAAGLAAVSAFCDSGQDAVSTQGMQAI